MNEFIRNFPFPNIREKQIYVLNEISDAFTSDYRYIILEAPTGFGKSAVAVAAALRFGTSYLCTATKDLQSQYKRDYPYLKVLKGKNNFPCAVKEDFIRNDTYRCGLLCVSNSANECRHTMADYGPCISNKDFEGPRCKYRTLLKDYKVINKGTREEEVFIDNDTMDYYKKEFSQWLHLKNLKGQQTSWDPCEYFDQLNIASASGHSILNYPVFFGLLPSEKILHTRELLILDEAHLLETEIVRFRGLSISKRKWKKYIPTLDMVDYGYDDIGNWIDFLVDLESEMLDLTGNNLMIEALSIYRKERYNWTSKKASPQKTVSEIFEDSNSISEKYETNFSRFRGSTISEEIAVEALIDTQKLTETINSILSNPRNWIVSEIKKKNYEIIRVKFKPLDTSQYWKAVFGKCNKTLMMSATILDKDAFCKSLGLAPEEVKFIQVPSDFPLQNRPIHPMNVAYLNSNSLQQHDVQIKIARTIDNLMTLYRNYKGIIHTTSYKQVDFIIENISSTNRNRLLKTDTNIPREEVIAEHIHSAKPTVLISPSLYWGLDLKDELSRFQIITKVPFPDLGDRWISKKKEMNEQWYSWQTALRLVQGYGRSIRSKEDWAKTYVLDSAFANFVNRNRNIIPDWFIQAIRPISYDLLKAPL